METIFNKRRSVRKFLPDAMTTEQINALLEAAIAAPSAGNRQPWHFYVIKNVEMREQICLNAYSQRFIVDAPICIAVCADANQSAERYGQRGIDLYCLQDTAAAIENILLCASEMGLGGCWIGAFDEGEVAKAMNLPEHLRPVALLPIGIPAPTPNAKRTPRRPMDEVVTFID